MAQNRHLLICHLINAIAVLTGTGLAFAQDTQDKPLAKQAWIRPSLEARFDIGAFGPVTHGPIPLSYRQIPHHPDDPGYSFTVPDAKLSSLLGYGYVSILPGLTFGNRLSIRGGPQFQPFTFTSGPARDTTSNSKEINQYGVAERGYGTSLVYYAGTGGGSAKIGYTGEVEVRVYKQFGIVGGYTSSAYNFNIERGYDRYDALQKLDSKPYSSDSIKNPYFGFRINGSPEDEPFILGIYFLTGPTFIQSNPVSQVGVPPFSQRDWSYRFAIALGYKRTNKH